MAYEEKGNGLHLVNIAFGLDDDGRQTTVVVPLCRRVGGRMHAQDQAGFETGENSHMKSAEGRARGRLRELADMEWEKITYIIVCMDHM